MRQYIILILILLSANSFSQNLQYVSDRITYAYGDLNEFITDYSDLDSLPLDIKILSTKILKNQTGDFASKMIFSWGNSIDLENYFKAYPDRLNFKNTIIPSYSLHYSFIDSSLGVSRYEVLMWLDKYGQITSLNFPHCYDFQAYDFLPLDNAKMISDSLILFEDFLYDDFSYLLKYDTLRNDLIWDIYYIRRDSLPNGDEYSDYLSFEISTRYHKLIKKELDTARVVFPIFDIDYDLEFEEIKLIDDK
ncbi:hypothetical protein [Carboxylicivirga sp. N1Y90]|uniref:hypothetical protein n=1 Tax=Carboxylicivirga fragile TaxID=3417571 RepID=UPI003D331023|nr:hypothetical protein [Marinilabiliaceae bacterium N1Y90]